MTDMSHWQMYTDAGNAALQAACQKLVATVEHRTQVEGAIQRMQKQLAKAGHGEVYDTEPEWEITDYVNKNLCVPRMWLPVERWDF